MSDDSMEECCFAPDKKSNPERGPTSRMSNSSPFDKKLEQGLVDRFGSQPSPQAGMGDTMSDKPFPSS